MTPNITPADRVGQINEYYLQRKMKEVATLNSLGRDIISLGIGGPDQAPPPAAIDTLCEEVRRPDVHSYQLGIGLPALRDAFARWYRRTYGVTLDPASEIIPLSGSKEGILHISMAFLNPGDSVLVPDPGYPTYTSVGRMVGARVIPYALSPDNGWQPDFDALDRSDLTGVRLMWLNYPHMPTGTRATRRIFDRAVEFGRTHSIVIVNDNPYSLILNDNPLSLLSSPGARDVAIELNSLSKSHNMAGWRMGMVASNPTFASWIMKMKSNIDSGQFKPVMLAAAQALAEGEEWHRALNHLYAARRAAAEEVMRSLRCEFDPAQQGLFLWGRIPDSASGSEALADRVLDLARVFVTPGSIFGANGERYIRISLCAPEERMREAAARIKAAGI